MTVFTKTIFVVIVTFSQLSAQTSKVQLLSGIPIANWFYVNDSRVNDMEFGFLGISGAIQYNENLHNCYQLKIGANINNFLPVPAPIDRPCDDGHIEKHVYSYFVSLQKGFAINNSEFMKVLIGLQTSRCVYRKEFIKCDTISDVYEVLKKVDITGIGPSLTFQINAKEARHVYASFTINPISLGINRRFRFSASQIFFLEFGLIVP